MQEGKFEGSAGIPIYFRRFGQAKRVLIVPNAVWLAADLEEFTRDRNVVFYDSRGRGRSGEVTDKTTISLESEIEDLSDVIRHLELEDVDLLGWSYHAGVIANYSSRNPAKVRRLILAAPMPPRKNPFGDEASRNLQSRLDMPAITQVMKSLPPDPVESCKAMAAVFFRPYFFDPAAQTRALASPCDLPNEWGRSLMPHMNAFMTSLGEWDWRPIAAGFAGPVLIVHGEQDYHPVTGSEEWQRSFPNARLRVAASSGHFLWLEQGELFSAWIREFLDEAHPDAGVLRIDS
jgi:proline iminopeptidase